jgi:formate/nitrite transporter FocA (FNT family)
VSDQTATPTAPSDTDAVGDTPEQKDQRKKEEAKDRRALSAEVVHDAVLLEGEEELERAPSALAWSALAAGLSMGFSLVAEAAIRHALPDAPWRPLVSKFGYALVFVLVVLGRQRLFTEDTLTAVIPVLEQRTAKSFGRLMRLWGVVLAVNVVGAVLFALFAMKTNAFSPEMRETFKELGHDAAKHDVATTFLKAIPAGWLIAMIPWSSPSAPQSRLWVALLFSYAVGIGEFSHVVAGTVELLALVFAGVAPIGEFFSFFLPTLLGNTIGGALLVALLGHAQARSGGKS